MNEGNKWQGSVNANLVFRTKPWPSGVICQFVSQPILMCGICLEWNKEELVH